jgi:hypothetical protein
LDLEVDTVLSIVKKEKGILSHVYWLVVLATGAFVIDFSISNH